MAERVHKFNPYQRMDPKSNLRTTDRLRFCNKVLDKKKSINSLDIGFVFNRVWHSAAWNKFLSHGFSTKFCRWISDFHSESGMEEVVDGQVPNLHKISAGVLQGLELV